jgi:hypothetical protein
MAVTETLPSIVDMARDACEQVPITAEDAAALAVFYCGYALDRVNDERDRPITERRLYNPGVISHLISMRVQGDAVVRLLDPSNDQKL